MQTTTPNYQRHRFPSDINSHAIWLSYRFCLSFREVEELFAERGGTVTDETIHQRCQQCGPAHARTLKNRQGRPGDTWYLDDVVVTIQGTQQYLGRAVDQDSNTIDILVQRRRNSEAAIRFFRQLLKGQDRAPRWMMTDTLKSYDAAHRTVMPTVEHLNHLYANNCAEVSHQPTRPQEYPLRGGVSSTQAQRFLTRHGLTQNVFRLSRHLIQAVNDRFLRTQACQIWKDAVCA